jgi:hypothetical protein
MPAPPPFACWDRRGVVPSMRGDRSACVENTKATLSAMRRYTLPGSYRPRLWLLCYQAVREYDAELARRALTEGVDWVRAVAHLQVPDPFRDSFLHRNPVNRTLLHAADSSAARR